MQELSAFASHLADEAGKIITRYFRTDFAIDTKSNETPVTVADREVELHLRKIIESERPDDGILGEETEAKASKNGFTWVLDPIDGTKSFTIGRPSFGTLIAYCKEWTPILGVIDQPILKERWIGDGHTARRGRGGRHERRRDAGGLHRPVHRLDRHSGGAGPDR